MLHIHGPFKKFFIEYYEISVFKQPYLKSGTLAKKGPYTSLSAASIPLKNSLNWDQDLHYSSMMFQS